MQSTNNFIVMTSIFLPTKAVAEFSKDKNFQLIVVGDKKTPQGWNCEKVIYLSVEDQGNLKYRISKSLPWNHYARKMIGYIYAIKSGARVIVDTDDDNLPINKWSVPSFCGDFLFTKESLGFVNIYKYFTDQHIWPRGFPLELITNPYQSLRDDDLVLKKVKIGVWQGLVNGDTDVDAIYRLTNNAPVTFREMKSIVLAKGTVCPFNSQNTTITEDLFPLLYLPAFVNFRFTDILRGLVAQPIMWLKNIHLGFTSPTAFQERNPHNLLEDFESEIPCYLLAEKIIEISQGYVRANYSIADNLFQVYEGLLKNGIVRPEEMIVLSDWLNDLEMVVGESY
jgi:hypothetical protein